MKKAVPIRSLSHSRRAGIILCLLGLLLPVLFLLNLFIGSVSIPPHEVGRILLGEETGNIPWQFIVLESRLPQAITALFAGAGLAVSGLMLQTAFHNPLAGPSILGINAGASLGVALVMLLMGGTLTAGSWSLGGDLAIVSGAFIGSMLIMGLLLFFSVLLKSDLLLLITGIMLGYITTSAISLLNFLSTAESIRNYTLWGMGNFNGVSMEQIPFYVTLTGAGIVLSLTLIKPLNALLLGAHYAENLGINLRRVRHQLLLATGLLTAVITAFCGPVSFLGLAVPHVARLMLTTANHRYLMPATLLLGGTLALICNLLCILPGETIIPLNAVTPILGAPVILYVILKRR